MIRFESHKSANLARRSTMALAALAAILLCLLTVVPARAGSPTGNVDGSAAALGARPLELTIAPVVSGTPVVGERLASTTGTWSPSSVAISFQWLADGVPIPGAIYSSYRPVGTYLGKRLSTAVTASKPGYMDRTAISEPSAPIRQGKARVEPNTQIGGEPRVGATLFAYTGTSTCCALTLSLQWLRDGIVIPGATQETYIPVQEDVGKRIRLRVTVSGLGYIPSTVTSPATAPVTAN